MSPVLKRPKEKFTLPSKYLLFLLTCVCIAIMVLSFKTPTLNTPLNSIAGVLLVPFQNGISEVGGWISDKSDQLMEIKDVLDENFSFLLISAYTTGVSPTSLKNILSLTFEVSTGTLRIKPITSIIEAG